jgi:hypothetical protein
LAARPSVAAARPGVRKVDSRPGAPPAAGVTPVEWSWASILERCRRVAKAESIVAMDGEGLPVAWAGHQDHVEAERVCAHVARSFDLLDRLKYVGRLAECLCVMYWPEGRWLTAVRIAPKVSAVVTVAVVGPYTMVDSGRRRLRNTFLQLLEETWPRAR